MELRLKLRRTHNYYYDWKYSNFLFSRKERNKRLHTVYRSGDDTIWRAYLVLCKYLKRQIKSQFFFLRFLSLDFKLIFFPHSLIWSLTVGFNVERKWFYAETLNLNNSRFQSCEFYFHLNQKKSTYKVSHLCILLLLLSYSHFFPITFLHSLYFCLLCRRLIFPFSFFSS